MQKGPEAEPELGSVECMLPACPPCVQQAAGTFLTQQALRSSSLSRAGRGGKATAVKTKGLRKATAERGGGGRACG